MKKKEVTNEEILQSVKTLTSTVDTLAQITVKGFESVNQKIDRHEAILNTVVRSIDGLSDDMKDVKNSISSVVTITTVQDKEISDLKHRVSRLEAKTVR